MWTTLRLLAWALIGLFALVLAWAVFPELVILFGAGFVVCVVIAVWQAVRD